jgi:hypothetical protein
MWSVTARGWEIMITCEPSTSTMSAAAALSPVATAAQHGGFYQAGGPDASLNAAAAAGRWVAAISAVCSAGRSAAKASRSSAGLIANSTEVSPCSSGILVLDQDRPQDAVLRAALDVAQVLPLLGGERGDKDQADDVRGTGGGVGDDRAAVGVPGQQHRTPSTIVGLTPVCRNC